MKKISYRSYKPKELEFIKNVPINSSKDFSENGNKANFIMPGELYVDPDSHSKVEQVVFEIEPQDQETKEAKEFLLSFIKQASKMSYDQIFSDYINKIYLSDIKDSSIVIKNLTIAYSQQIKDYVSDGLPLEKAKGKSFEFISRQAIVKSAQTYEPPEVLAESFKSLIYLLMSRVKLGYRQTAKIKLRKKIKGLSYTEISSKKTNAGSAIGTAIALLKNALAGKDPIYIKMVLEQLNIII